MLEKVKAAVPELVTVTDWVALATLMPLEKVRVEAERVTAGVPVVVVVLLLLDPPPQPTRATTPTMTANSPTKVRPLA